MGKVERMPTLSPLSQPQAGTVRIEPASGANAGIGAGFLVGDTRKLIVTCYHVVNTIQEVTVHFEGGGTSYGRVVSFLQETDIAVIKLWATAPLNCEPLSLGSTKKLPQYHKLVCFGYGNGNPGSPALATFVQTYFSDGKQRMMLQSTGLTVGFSGGALFDQDSCKVVGVYRALRTPDPQGRQGEDNFGIPVETWAHWVESIPASPPVPADWGNGVGSRRSAPAMQGADRSIHLQRAVIKYSVILATHQNASHPQWLVRFHAVPRTVEGARAKVSFEYLVGTHKEQRLVLISKDPTWIRAPLSIDRPYCIQPHVRVHSMEYELQEQDPDERAG